MRHGQKLSMLFSNGPRAKTKTVLKLHAKRNNNPRDPNVSVLLGVSVSLSSGHLPHLGGRGACWRGWATAWTTSWRSCRKGMTGWAQLMRMRKQKVSGRLNLAAIASPGGPAWRWDSIRRRWKHNGSLDGEGRPVGEWRLACTNGDVFQGVFSGGIMNRRGSWPGGALGG